MLLTISTTIRLLAAMKFRHREDFAPISVRQIVDQPDVFEERTADQWQRDAFGQVHAWLSALDLR